MSYRVDDPTLPRQERSRRTVKAHQVLDSIAARIQAIEQRTLESESMEMRAALWAQLGGVRKALAAVNRRAPSLVSRKDQLFLSLSKLEKQIDEHAKNIDATSKAVKYDSCEWWLRILKGFILMISKPIISIIPSIAATRLLRSRSSSV